MRINAYERFLKTIDENIGMPVSARDVEDEIELADMLKELDRIGFSLIRIKELYRLGSASATETVYDNGLIKLESVISYKEKAVNSEIKTIRQTSIFSSYDEEPLVNLTTKEEAKAWQQFLVDSSPKNDIFNNKDIKIKETSINFGEKYCGSHFITYRNLRDNSLILKKYRQGYPISKYKDESDDLIRLCGDFSRYLEIIYKEGEPIYAELSDKYNVAMANFNPNDPIDVKCIVDRIDEEIDAICGVIATNLTEFQKNKDEKKRVKTP